MKNSKYILVSILLVSQLQAANWYVDNRVIGTSDNSGTSWANAHTNFTSIRFNKFSAPAIAAGDTVWISGGPVGGTNIYAANLVDAGSSTDDGTLGSPITIKVGNDITHGGVAKIIGGISLSRKYWIIDGSKTSWIPNSVLDTYNIPTNINLEVYQTNATMAVQMFGTGAKCKWVHISEMSSLNDCGIWFGASSAIGDGNEIAYNYISRCDGFGIRSEFPETSVVSNSWGQLSVHHNLLHNVANNFFQFSGWVDVYKNVCYDEHVFIDGWSAYAGHPDPIQEVNAYSRVWNNIFYNYSGSRFYIEANTNLTHDILAYNNLYYSTTNWYGRTMTNRAGVTSAIDNPGTGFNVTGHDSEAGQPCNLSNIWIFNNTLLMRGTVAASPSAVIWQRGSVAGRPSGWVTNFNVYNNNIIGLAPYNSSVTLQFFTNQVAQNGIVGFEYDSNNVAVDFNSVNGFTSSGRGIVWGPKGDASPLNPYATMADFTAATQYKSNNNATANYVSFNPTLTNGLSYDFRPQIGDAALIGLGTNLTSITNFAPEADKDLLGISRGTSWDIGAYQHPEGFWVATNGVDASTNGSFTFPWRTIQYGLNRMTAGNVLNVATGNYNEYVDTATNGTGESGRIIIRGYPANNPNSPVETKCFRVKHRFITIEGFRIRKTTGANGAMIRIEAPGASANGSDCVITNNTICDGVMLFSRTADFGTNYVHIRDAYEGTDFNTAGFVAGMNVYLGSDSLNAYTNHGSLQPSPGYRTVLSNSTDGLTMYFTGVPLLDDPGTNYWIAILAGGSGAASWRGIYGIGQESGYGPCSNLVIAANTFSNLVGIGIDLGVFDGTNRIVNNEMTKLHGGQAFRGNASNLEFGHNFIHDNNVPIYFISDELTNPNLHPGGGGYFDFVGNITVFSHADLTNIWFHHNWIQKVDCGLGTLDNNSNSFGFRMERNVYVAVSLPSGFGITNLLINNNTFLKCAYEGSTPVASDTHDGLIIVSNVFFEAGQHVNLSQEAPYGLVTVTNPVLMSNYAVQAETIGFTNMAAVTGSFGAGDPLFINARDPLGPDGLPFTEDDGLRPLPNSVLALQGLGALTPHQIDNYPRAHFAVRVLSWQDATGTNFDVAYALLKPHERTNNIRPWNTYEAIGTSNATIVLTAEQSVDGFSLTNSSITAYRWLFNGSNAVTSVVPTITNTFTASTNWVQLYVTNSAGSWGTYSNAYRVIYGTEGGGGEPPAGTNPPGTVIKANVNILSF